MAKAPKCKICGQSFWGICAHPGYLVTPTVTPVTRPVTKERTVTPVVTRFVPSEQEMIEAAVSPEHECPICGLLHHRPKTQAERAKEYRERQRA